MTGTPEWLKEKICAYYVATTESSYLQNWGRETLALHLGLADENTSSHEESLINMNVFLADKAEVGPDTRVLDAGCGVGGSAFWLATERGAEVVGITIVPEQVDIARRIARERGLEDRVSFQCMDFASTDFPEASFDVVWNIESLCHTPDARAYLRHVHYLLRDGGRFVCADLLRVGDEPSEYERDACEGWAMPPLRTLAEVEEAIRDAGFCDIEAFDWSNRLMRSAQTLNAMAQNAMLLVKAEKAMLGKADPLYEKHVQAGISWHDGMAAGVLAGGFFGAVRPPR